MSIINNIIAFGSDITDITILLIVFINIIVGVSIININTGGISSLFIKGVNNAVNKIYKLFAIIIFIINIINRITDSDGVVTMVIVVNELIRVVKIIL